ncbi:MAG: alpha-L-fucosidase [Chitinophagaceae bacterium]
MNFRNYLAAFPLVTLIVAFASCSTVKEPEPYGVIPKDYQLKILEIERYALMHFTPTTYQNKEWGFGDADPKIFNPTKFSADQIVQTLKDAGFKSLTVVAKHHDGFCLWPTSATEYNISKSPFRDGKGDLVMEMRNALDKAGMSMGIYCSPWDRNSAVYADKKYVTDVYYTQLKELYTRYGPFVTIFMDGANGGDGYYGGANEKRKIEASTYYNFDTIFSMIRRLQPTANIFSDIGPDLRWVGNESGQAGETSWETFTPIGKDGKTPAPGLVDDSNLGSGTRNGKQWTPAECDVPLRPGWFYHPEQEDNVRTPEKMMELYYASVGRGGTLDVGISPTPDGILCDGDVAKLKKFGGYINSTFAENLAKKATIKVSDLRSSDAKFAAENLIDDDRYSYWSTNDGVTTPEAEFSFTEPVKFNVFRLRENIKLGQRIEKVAFDIWENNNWKEVATTTSIGANRLVRLGDYVTTTKVRLRVMASPVCVAISDFGLFAEPEELVHPKITGDANSVFKKEWKAPGFEKAIDNDPATFAIAPNKDALILDLGKTISIITVTYLPRQDKSKDGIISKYTIYTSVDGKEWNQVSKGEFSNIVNNPVEQKITLEKTVQAKFIKLEANELAAGKMMTVAEVAAY